MFDAQCDLAALVYTEGEDPDESCMSLPPV